MAQSSYSYIVCQWDIFLFLLHHSSVLGQLLLVHLSRILKIKIIFNNDQKKMWKEKLFCEYKCVLMTQDSFSGN